MLLSSIKATPQIKTPQLTFGHSVNQRTLRKDPKNLEAKRICYSEEHQLNKMNQNSLPLSTQNKTQQIKHNPIPTSYLSWEAINHQ
jgi:hypothetical protein